MPELAGSENVLREGLRSLSRSGAREAPPWVQERLLRAFRRQNAARRRRRVLSLAGMAAALILVSSLMLVRDRTLPPSAGGLSAAGTPAIETQSSSASQLFVPVLYGQRPVAEGPAIVVRLQMPAADLRLVGVPVEEEVANRTIQAEVALGPDGLPYALRLLPDNNFSHPQGVKP